MQFFEQQDSARKSTVILVFSLLLVSLATILTAYLVLLVVYSHGAGLKSNPWLFSASTIGAITAFVLSAVLVGALTGFFALKNGAESIIRLVRGLEVDRANCTPEERILLNVVEEISIAAGIPVPRVVVLRFQGAINAFSVEDEAGGAVIGVTQGTLKLLNRDELQGVVAHEFSHLVNRDSLLSLRVSSLLYGISLPWNIGVEMLSSLPRSEGDAGFEESSNQQGSILLLLPGIFLTIIGLPGKAFGPVIKSVLSQEREFLADASAAQFTRNPAAIASALKKIGGLPQGSAVRCPAVSTINHFFFADAESRLIPDWIQTHPALEDRILAIEPGFDGSYPEITPVDIREVDFEVRARDESLKQLSSALNNPVSIGVPTEKEKTVITVTGLFGVPGLTNPEHLVYASTLIRSFPPALLERLRNKDGAQAAVFALLLSRANSEREPETQRLATLIDKQVMLETNKLFESVRGLTAAQHLPLIDLAMPILKKLSAEDRRLFITAITAIVNTYHSDDLFGYLLKVVLCNRLDFSQTPQETKNTRELTDPKMIKQLGTRLLQALAHSGNELEGFVHQALSRAKESLGADFETTTETNHRVSLSELDQVLAQLKSASDREKNTLLRSCVACITADEFITVEEAETLRIIAVALGCPIPPIVPQTH